MQDSIYSIIANTNDPSLKKFIKEVKDFALKYIIYNKVEDAEDASLNENGPLAKIFNKYIKDGTLKNVERKFRAYYEGQCEIPHVDLEVSYLSNAYGFWKSFTITI